MARDYRLLVDWDQDEFFCREVQPSDSLNLIRGALQKTLMWDDVWHYTGFTVARRYEEHDAGLWIYRATQEVGSPFLNGVPNGITFGSRRVDPIPIGSPRIPVVSGQTYSARVLMKVNAGSTSLALVVDDGASFASATVTATPGVWTPLSVTFVAPAGTTEIRLFAWQGIFNGAQDLEVRGLIMVEGSTLPTSWNAGDATNVYDNISSAVRDSLSFSDGLTYNDNFATPSLMTFVLNDPAGLFNPNNDLSPFYTSFRHGIYLQLEAERSGTTYPLWRGVTNRLTFYGEDDDDRHVYVEAEDAALLMTDSDYTPGFDENIRVDVALRQPFERGAVIYPYAGSFGVLGASTIGDTMVLFHERMTDFAEADSTLPYSGDNIDSGQGINTQTYLREILAAELGGRLFYDAPSGKYVFHNRLRDSVDDLTVYTPGNPLSNPSPPEIVYGEDVVNHIDLNYELRSIGAAGTEIWRMDNVPFTVAAETSRTINARYIAASTDVQIAVKNGVAPVATLDYDANYGDSPFENALATTRVLAVFDANTARVTVYNDSTRPLSVTLLRLRGTPIYRTKAQTVIARNPNSIARNGLRKRSITVPSISDEAYAQQVANVRAAEESTPTKLVRRVTFIAEASDDTELTILQAKVGDVLHFDALDSVEDYLVLGRDHRIVLENNTHLVTYTVKALVRTAILIMGSPIRGLLGQGVLGL